MTFEEWHDICHFRVAKRNKGGSDGHGPGAGGGGGWRVADAPPPFHMPPRDQRPPTGLSVSAQPSLHTRSLEGGSCEALRGRWKTAGKAGGAHPDSGWEACSPGRPVSRDERCNRRQLPWNVSAVNKLIQEFM